MCMYNIMYIISANKNHDWLDSAAHLSEHSLSTHRCTDDFNGAQLKAVCVEAGMIALRRKAEELAHEDYMDGQSLACMCIYMYMYVLDG